MSILARPTVGVLRPILRGPYLLYAAGSSSHHITSKTKQPAVRASLPSTPHAYRESTVYMPSVTEKSHEQHITICWIDAAPSAGLIAVVNESQLEYQLFNLNPGWGSDGKNNNWAETVGFELLALWLVARQCTGKVLVNCDSTTALGVFAGIKNSSQHLNEVGFRLKNNCQEWPFIMRARWVKGKLNLADRPSRGKGNPGYNETKCEIDIPGVLKRYISCKK